MLSIRRHVAQARVALRNRLRGDLSVEWYRARGMEIGENVYIGRGSRFDTGLLHLISIGDNTTVSSGVEVLAHDAAMRRHLGYTLIDRVTIGSRVYIGAGSIVLPGVTIGDDAVVGAGSVVTKDVSPATVVAGNPAQVIKTTEQLVEEHRRRMANRPVFPMNGWTTSNGRISDQNSRRMREELESGPGYIR